MLDRVTRAKPAKAGKIFGAPGDGSSGLISFATTVVLVALWFTVTESGWVKPLFLPSPLAVWDKFILALTDGVSNSTLIEHTLASIGRVFGAFLLALVTAVPIGILMGSIASCAASSIRSSNFTGRCRRLPTCRW